MIVHLVEIVLLGNLKMYLDDTIVEVTATTYPEIRYTAISRKVVRKKKCARGNPERYYGIWSIHFSWHCRCRTYFSCFPLALTTILHGLSCHSFKFFLKNIEPKSPHNTFRACRVHFFRQPFSKKLYIQSRLVFLSRCAIHARSTRYANLDKIINLRYARRGINWTREARNHNLQVVITHASHVCSQHLFGLPLRVNSIECVERVFWPSVTWHVTAFEQNRFDLRSLSPALLSTLVITTMFYM